MILSVPELKRCVEILSKENEKFREVLKTIANANEWNPVGNRADKFIHVDYKKMAQEALYKK